MSPTPTERDFEGAHTKFCAQGPEFLATALSAEVVFRHTIMLLSGTFHKLPFGRLASIYCKLFSD